MSEAHTADLGTRYRYRQEGAEAERERIIEIIERCPRADDDYMILCDARHLIALIKGEQK